MNDLHYPVPLVQLHFVGKTFPESIKPPSEENIINRYLSSATLGCSKGDQIRLDTFKHQIERYLFEDHTIPFAGLFEVVKVVRSTFIEIGGGMCPFPTYHPMVEIYLEKI